MGVGALALLVTVAPAPSLGRTPTPRCPRGVFCAGTASVDMTWHTGSGQGQYATEGNGVTADRFDPFHHQTKQVPSHGMQSRLYAKALVVRGPDGTKAAYVKTELYLQQDLLTRRVGQLVSGADPTVADLAVEGLEPGDVMLGGTHNHSAPYYASTAWGVWLFTDTFDFRMFESTARRIATAIKRADRAMVPARVGASVSRFDAVQRNILGPAVADDGTPAGYPHDWFDDELAVVRFDTADGGRPIGALVNLGMHPESLDTIDMISADFVGMVERMAERGMGRPPGSVSGPVVAWSQGAVGDIEPDRDGLAHPTSARREYWHRDLAQAERMSEAVAEAVLDTWRDVVRGTPGVRSRYVPPTTEAPVAMVDRRFAGPVSHPLPTVSNCRTEEPGVPVAGLPDCVRPEGSPEQLGTTLSLLREGGVPVPSNYSVPSHTGVQEATTIHLQTLRIGDVLLAACPCEPTSDMVLNLRSRTDGRRKNLHNGFEWPCTDRGEGGVLCDFRTAAHRPPDERMVDRAAYRRMRAQIRNDARGWEEDVATVQSESEPADPAEIRGNYTHEEIQDLRCGASRCRGYRLPLMVGQANDYIGYVVTYREYMRGDHYRKALTAFGPHTSDYVNTRLVGMGAELQGARPSAEGALVSPTASPTAPLDELIQQAKTAAVGAAAGGGLAAYEAVIPDDGGSPGRVLAQPSSLRRFGAATLRWEGGSNWTDNPAVVVQRRRRDGSWRTVATQEGGEVVLTLAYESPLSTAPIDWLAGGKTYEWTATFEVFERTPPGTYRFVVSGRHRTDRRPQPYRLVSRPFEVMVWEGISAHGLAVSKEAGVVTFEVSGVERTEPVNRLETDPDGRIGPDEVHYPESYESSLEYVSRAYEVVGEHRYCWRCTFRPWANTGAVERAVVTVRRPDGSTRRYRAAVGDGRWVADAVDLREGDVVLVEAGGVVDQAGNRNGRPSERVVVG